LGTHTTLQTQSGDLTLHDAINSAGTGFYDLNLHSGGTTTVLGALGVGRALRNVVTDDNLSAANRSDGLPGGEHTRFEAVNDGGQATIVATERIVFNDPVTSSVDTRWQAGTQVLAESTGNRLSQTVSINTAQVSLFNATNLQLGEVRLTGSLDSDIVTDGVMTLTDNVNLSAGSLLLQANATPTTLADFTSPEFAGKVLTVGLSAALGEASLGLSQTGGTITTAANALLAVRTPGGASISLMQSGNDLAGAVSAVSGRIGESLTSLRPLTPIDGKVRAGFLRIQSRQLNVAGRPVDDSDQSLLRAGLEADVIELNLDGLNTALNNGLVRARLPYDNNQGSLTAMPALTINVSALGLNTLKAFGGVETTSRIAVSVGNSTGGFVTVKPKNGASLGPGYVSLGGDKDAKPFYDGSGKITEVPVFYNGDVPQSPQAVGALSAVTAVIEEARRARFEEAVRTENVSARLRSGVIAEVGSGRPATEGSDSIRMPDTCSPKANSLGC
ncbi:MAG TPA: hypothetical protein PKV17_11445, partial [Aquabacterium sp.]|nr:hypothetical protein [Aquabacterium sp.]